MNDNETGPSSQPGGNTSSEGRQQTREIMQQPVAEGLFAPCEAAEITFSDAVVIRTPDLQTSDRLKKAEKKRFRTVAGIEYLIIFAYRGV